MPQRMPGLAGTLILMLFWALPSVADDSVITAQEAFSRQNSKTLTIIDIRRPSEWGDTGIAADALAITMHDPAGQSAFLANVTNGVGGDKTVPIGLICASGVRSTWANGFLTRNGFTNIYNIKEGMLGRGQAVGWIRQGLPTVPVPVQ